MMKAAKTDGWLYPTGTESYEAHRGGCRLTLTGHHRGNRYCVDHKVKVAEPGDL